MRITFLSPFTSLAGGVRVMSVYAAKLQELGHDVTVVSRKGKQPSLKARMKAAVGLKKIRQPRKATPLLEVLGSKHVVVENDGPITAADVPDSDVVVATFWETAPWVAALPASKGEKWYLLQDYETFKKGRSEEVSATYDLPLKKIAVSAYIADMLEKNHSIKDVKVVPNSVDLTQFQAPARQKGAKLTIGFLYTGKPRKNVAMAIEVLERTRTVIPDLKAVAFGSIAPIERIPVPDWIDYHQAPDQSQIADIYASCDIWLFTSEHEGFGLPILEAMACGTPVLATHAGAAPQIVNGENGSLLDTKADDFVTEIQRISKMSDEDWRKMSDAARATAQRYSWDQATDLLLKCFVEEDAQVSV